MNNLSLYTPWVIKCRRCEDAKMRRGFQKIWRVEDAKMQRCGEGFRKSGEPKMRRCEDAERVTENLESRRCKDAKMQRCGEGFRKSGELKMRRYEDVMLRQPPQYLPIQCYEDAKMQRCDDARPGQCPLSATCLAWSLQSGLCGATNLSRFSLPAQQHLPPAVRPARVPLS